MDVTGLTVTAFEPRLGASQYTRTVLFDLVAGVGYRRRGVKLLLDASHANKSAQDVDAASLVIRPARSAATKWLLAYNRTRALAVDIEVPCRVAEFLLCEADNGAITRKNRASESILRNSVDDIVDRGSAIYVIIIDIDRQDGSEELRREELMVWRLGHEDCRLDVVSNRAVVFSSRNQLEVRVFLALINSRAQLLEGGGMDDRANEVAMILRWTDLQLLRFLDEKLLEIWPYRLGDVQSGSSAALLALVLKRTADRLDNSVS